MDRATQCADEALNVHCLPVRENCGAEQSTSSNMVSAVFPLLSPALYRIRRREATSFPRSAGGEAVSSPPLRQLLRRREGSGTPVLRPRRVHSRVRVSAGGALEVEVSPGRISLLLLCPLRAVVLREVGEEYAAFVCPGGGVEVAAAPSLWTFVPLSPLPLRWYPLRCQHSGRGDLYRSGSVDAARLPGSAAGVSSWFAVQEQGLRLEGGGSGGFPRRRRRGWPDSGPELHGDEPRSTLHIDISFVRGEALHRLTKPLDGDGVPPVSRRAGGVSSSLPAGVRRRWEGPAAMVLVELGDFQGLLCNFPFLGSSLLLFLDSSSVSKLRVVSACVCYVYVVSLF